MLISLTGLLEGLQQDNVYETLRTPESAIQVAVTVMFIDRTFGPYFMTEYPKLPQILTYMVLVFMTFSVFLQYVTGCGIMTQSCLLIVSCYIRLAVKGHKESCFKADHNILRRVARPPETGPCNVVANIYHSSPFSHLIYHGLLAVA